MQCFKWLPGSNDNAWIWYEVEYENALSKRPNEPHVTVGLCYQYSLLIEQNERSAEAAASDQTVWRRKQIGHAKPASPQQTNSLFMGFTGAEKVNLLLSLEESLGPHEKDSGYNYRFREGTSRCCAAGGTSRTANKKKVSKIFPVIFRMISGHKHQVSFHFKRKQMRNNWREACLWICLGLHNNYYLCSGE